MMNAAPRGCVAMESANVRALTVNFMINNDQCGSYLRND